MDWEAKLKLDTMDQLQQRARNAAGVLAAQPDTDRGREADKLLTFIESERARRSLPGSIDSFLSKYPDGFQDDLFDKNERRDKVAASLECQTTLGSEAFEAGDIEQLIQAVRKVVNMTNLIQGRFEKPKLLDKIAEPQHSEHFLRELKALLHGHDPAPNRLEVFSDYMHTLGLRKWTYPSYFLFLNDPTSCTFVKPEGLQRAVKIAGYPVDYDSAPTAHIYSQILAFAHWIEGRLKNEGREELIPRDMIDTQSFIWHMAPTGKFRRE